MPMMQKAKNDQELYTKGANSKLDIINVVNHILTLTTASMMTTPNIQFHVDKSQKIGDAFIEKLSVDDCDKALPPKIKIVKVESDIISIEYDLKKEYYASINKPILKISIQCALIKNDKHLWSENEEKIQFDDSSQSEDSHSSNNESSDSASESMSDSEENSSDDEGNKTFAKSKKKKKRKKKKKEKKK